MQYYENLNIGNVFFTFIHPLLRNLNHGINMTLILMFITTKDVWFYRTVRRFSLRNDCLGKVFLLRN